jgi:predicted CXXCH cytochrome family protein
LLGEAALLTRSSSTKRLAAQGLAWAALMLIDTSALLAASLEEDNETCVSCHGQEDLSMTLDNGQIAPLFMKSELLAASVHKKLRCTDCHAGLDEVPHPSRRYQDLSQFRASFIEACKKCHGENYSKTLDSVHYRVQARGDAFAPTCVKCHGSHDIARPAEPRARISKTCASCHLSISETYAKSVHGKALIEQNNPDVPVCTDCHRTHNIADPKNLGWRLSTPSLCGKCHADEKRMKKYGLSTAVLSSYVADFHGTTASFGARGSKSDERVVALCVDCHGVHDIGKTTGAGAAMIRGNLVKTCRKCHPNASENFPSAWLNHYEPSLTRAPLVYLIKLFYKLLIPFIVGGLLLQVVLHLRRTVVKR